MALNGIRQHLPLDKIIEQARMEYLRQKNEESAAKKSSSDGESCDITSSREEPERIRHPLPSIPAHKDEYIK